MFRFNAVLSIILLGFVLASCSMQKKISKIAKADLIEEPGLNQAHVGIHIYEPATGRVWYDYQGDHYFVPASNTKIPTCYAAMHFLGDSIPALQYQQHTGVLLIRGTGSPDFLHPDFADQPALRFLQEQAKRGMTISIIPENWQDQHWGSGWSWNDYMEYYMAERSPLPVYGNVIRWALDQGKLRAKPSFFNQYVYDAALSFPDSSRLLRSLSGNETVILPGRGQFSETEMPFATNGYATAALLLRDTLKLASPIALTNVEVPEDKWQTVFSRPVDSILEPMMHRSDNFFAEQSLMMLSQKILGRMSDAAVIDTLLKSVFADLPQQPRWVDGSGLSRYNLFSPRDFVWILNKMKEEQGMERIKAVLPTGGEGTIRSYYKADSGYIYVKTGTLSNVVALSGFLETSRHRHLIFSLLVNNHQVTASQVRESFEKLLQTIRNSY